MLNKRDGFKKSIFFKNPISIFCLFLILMVLKIIYLYVNVMDVTLSEGIFKLKICFKASEERQIYVFPSLARNFESICAQQKLFKHCFKS
jgi:hypothetical protein